jgi:hypothetical protein
MNSNCIHLFIGICLLTVAVSSLSVHHSKAQDFYSSFGYITVNASANAQMFYGFFPSLDGNESAPVILWLQGKFLPWQS